MNYHTELMDAQDRFNKASAGMLRIAEMFSTEYVKLKVRVSTRPEVWEHAKVVTWKKSRHGAYFHFNFYSPEVGIIRIRVPKMIFNYVGPGKVSVIKENEWVRYIAKMVIADESRQINKKTQVDAHKKPKSEKESIFEDLIGMMQSYNIPAYEIEKAHERLTKLVERMHDACRDGRK